MAKVCKECLGSGFIEELDGDGQKSEVICSTCLGGGSVYDPDDPDNERD